MVPGGKQSKGPGQMGWTYWQSEPRSTDEVLRAEYGQHTILASACKGGVWYAALKPSGASYVTALVVLYERKGGGFGYKPMDEGMGPNAADCPGSVLRLLSPVSDLPIPAVCREWAQKWREACAAKVEG